LFILKVLFHKGEYNLNDKSFNPFKVLVIIILHLNIVFTIILVYKINNLYPQLEQCIAEKEEKAEKINTLKYKLEDNKKQ